MICKYKYNNEWLSEKDILKIIASKKITPEILALEIASKMSYSVEVKTALQGKGIQEMDTEVFTLNTDDYIAGDWANPYTKNGVKITKEEFDKALELYRNKFKNTPTQHYSNLTVPGGTNYTENRIITPQIVPSIKGHAQFAEKEDIGWFRSDDTQQGKHELTDDFTINGITYFPFELINDDLRYYKANYEDYDNNKEDKFIEITEKEYNDKLKEVSNNTKTRRILELQSDLFQKGRDKEELTISKKNALFSSVERDEELMKLKRESKITKEEYNKLINEEPVKLIDTSNQFLQLLNKDNNWVTFFIKSIIQDTAKQTITEVQESDVEAKIRELEKEGLLEIDCSKIKAKDGIRSKFTKGSKWEIVKDLKGYPSHSQGGVDIKIGKNGFSFTRDNGVIEAKYGLVLPKIK